MKNNEYTSYQQSVISNQPKNKLLQLLKQNNNSDIDNTKIKSLKNSHPENKSPTKSSELSSLLQTNKILIQNKINVHENKIRILNQRLMKLQKLVKNTYDREECQQLHRKIEQIESKRRESEGKLEKIRVMRVQMERVEDQREKENWEGNRESREEQWRIKQSYNECMQTSKHRKQSLYDRVNMQVSHLQDQQFSQLKSRSRCLSMHNSLKQNRDTLHKTTQLSHKQTLSMKWPSKTVHKNHQKQIQQLSSSEQFQAQNHNNNNNNDYDNGSIYDVLHQKKQSERGGKYSRKNSLTVSGNKVKINQFVGGHQKQNGCGVDGYALANIKYIDSKLTKLQEYIAYELGQQKDFSSITTLLQNSIAHPIIPLNKYLSDIQTIIQTLSECTMQTSHKASINQRQAEQLKSIQTKQLQKLISKQTLVLEQIDQLSSLNQQLTDQTVLLCQKYSGQFSNIVSEAKRVSKDYENVAISGVYWEDEGMPEIKCAVQNYWRSFQKMIKVCYLGMLEVAERKLAAQYKLSNTSIQQQQSQKHLQQTKQTLLHHQTTLQQTQQHLQALQKQITKLQTSKSFLLEEVEQFENLQAIRKSNLKELQEKYNGIKSKKSKLEKNMKNLEEMLEVREQEFKGVDGRCGEREGYLGVLEGEVRKLEKEREKFRKEMIEITRQFNEKQQQNKAMTDKIEAKKSEADKIQKQIKKHLSDNQNLQQKLKQTTKKLTVLNTTLSQTQEQLTQTLQNKKTATSSLTSLTNQLQQKTHKASQLQQQINLCQQSYSALLNKKKQLQKQVIKFQSEEAELNNARGELEEILGDILQRKQIAIEELEKKYRLVKEQEEIKAVLEEEVGELGEQIQNREKYIDKLDHKIYTLEQQISISEKDLRTGDKTLQEICQRIDQYHEQQQSLQTRIQALRTLQTKLTLSTAIRKQNNKHNILTNQELSTRIQSIMQSIENNKKMQMQLTKQKQEKRRLKLDNDRLKKLVEMDDRLIDQ